MDQRAREKEKEKEDLSLSDHRCKDDVDAAADEVSGMNNHGDSTDQQRGGGYEEAEEEEIRGGVLMEVVGGRGSEEASAPLLAHHPCTLLQLLLRACAGYLGLHGYCSVDDDPKPAADEDVPAVVATADSPQEGDPPRDGDKAASETEEVVNVVWRAARRRLPPAPGRPREGPGGNGGNHH